MTRFSAVLLSAALATGAAGLALAADGTPPKVDTKFPTPVIYPTGAQANGEEGSVDLAVYIPPNGRPDGRYQITGSSEHKDLDDAAVQSVMNWHYLPARGADGGTQAGWVRLHLNYKLPPK